LLPYYGTVGGKRVARRTDLYEIDNVLEKPTPSEAEQRLLVPGLRAGYYLCLFGIHVFTPTVWTCSPSGRRLRTRCNCRRCWPSWPGASVTWPWR